MEKTQGSLVELESEKTESCRRIPKKEGAHRAKPCASEEGDKPKKRSSKVTANPEDTIIRAIGSQMCVSPNKRIKRNRTD